MQCHPTDRPHLPDFDDAIRDTLIEACAFAWIQAQTAINHPTLDVADGEPDIRALDGVWADSKNVPTSDKERELDRRMQTGEVVVGKVADCSWIYFNIAGIDTDSSCGNQKIRGNLLAQCRTWRAQYKVRVVVTYQYEWTHQWIVREPI